MSSKIYVKAKIYAVTDGTTAPKAYANVAIGDLLNVNSYVVTNTFGDPDRMNAFAPSRKDRLSGGYKPFVEFAYPAKNALVSAIKKACQSAYELYSSTGRLHEYGRAFAVDIDNLFGSAEKPAKIVENTDFGSSAKYPDEIPDEFDMGKALAEAGF